MAGLNNVIAWLEGNGSFVFYLNKGVKMEPLVEVHAYLFADRFFTATVNNLCNNYIYR